MSFPQALYITIGLFFFALYVNTAHCDCGCGKKSRSVAEAEQMFGLRYWQIAAICSFLWPIFLSLQVAYVWAAWRHEKKS